MRSEGEGGQQYVFIERRTTCMLYKKRLIFPTFLSTSVTIRDLMFMAKSIILSLIPFRTSETSWKRKKENPHCTTWSGVEQYCIATYSEPVHNFSNELRSLSLGHNHRTYHLWVRYTEDLLLELQYLIPLAWLFRVPCSGR